MKDAPAAVQRTPRAAASEALISIRRVAKSYSRGEQRVPVLTDINLDIGRGDFVALMGPSGSGKSTLLNLIAGIDKPDAGTMTIAGEDITRWRNRAGRWRAASVGFIFQFYNLMPVLTAHENVELPLLLTRCRAASGRSGSKRCWRWSG
jgi:putative ABC transport system ATP-binding protein